MTSAGRNLTTLPAPCIYCGHDLLAHGSRDDECLCGCPTWRDEPPDNDSRPDPRTHPEYWTE